MDENQLRALLDEKQLQAHLTLGHASPDSAPSYVEWRLDQNKAAKMKRDATLTVRFFRFGIVVIIALSAIALLASL